MKRNAPKGLTQASPRGIMTEQGVTSLTAFERKTT
jgi:hypothetical protein